MFEECDDLNAKLAAYRAWIAERELQSCELVHYSGVCLIGVKELTLDQVEQEIVGLLEEAFYVDWIDHESKLYLRVWEYGGPEPEWAKVFAHDDLADVDAIMQRVEIIVNRTALGLAAIKKMLNDPGEDNCVALFVEHHLEEIEPEYWVEQIGTAQPTPSQVLDLLVVRSHWGSDDEDEDDDDGIKIFDYTLPAEKTDYVLSVSFAEDGSVENIDMES